uniref:Pre-mRNA-splicing regulator WTAP n=1 Tax=Babesia bovis TaxID=5865 RepID=S6B3J5_BABBO|nr:conserved hypothetical protein [Babesia bovis]
MGDQLAAIVTGAEKLTNPADIMAYFMTIISAQQKEIQKTKALVKDFRTVHNLDGIYEKNATINAMIDPVINCEILHLRKLLKEKEVELKTAKEALDAQNYNPQSTIGTTLLERCKLLITENEELGRIVLENKVQPLTMDLYKEREANKVLKKQLKALHQYNIELEAEAEVMSKNLAQQKLELAALKKEMEAITQKTQAKISPKKKKKYMPGTKSNEVKQVDKINKDDKEERVRKEDKRDRYTSTRKEETHESDRKLDKRETERKVDKHVIDRKADRYESTKQFESSRSDKYTRRDDRHTSKKEERTRRDDSRGRTSTKRYREDSRSRTSPYRNRSPKSGRSSRKY